MGYKSLDEILPGVEKPARYTGGEWNMVLKQDAKLKFALCFPDVYEIGMSHLGSRILYNILNMREEIACERVFAPWPDMERSLLEAEHPLFSLESKLSLDKFDIIGFSLLYELCYTNVLSILRLGNIPLLAKEREERHPLVICGGTCACNAEPLADFMDAVLLGDGEELLLDVLDAYLQERVLGRTKHEILLRLSEIKGVYVPSFYEAEYNSGRFYRLSAIEPSAPERIERRVVKDLENTPYLGKPIVPNVGIVHDRIALELFRGCTRGCRFCQAGYIYRPVRERKKETLIQMAHELVKETGYDEISLFSLSSSDYSCIHELVPELLDSMQDQKVSISLPSLRIDSSIKEDLERMQAVRKAGLTFAPEAGTQRLRDVINKGVTEQNLLNVTREAFDAGWTGIKLYFMIGLPTETDDDILGIAELARSISKEYSSRAKRTISKPLRLTISVSSFVPKPFTPFQWVAQDSPEELRRKQQLLKSALKGIRGVEYKYHDSNVSLLEAAFSRGDRRLGRVLLEAYNRGCRFDSWAEHFKFELWMEAFEACGLTPSQFANQTIDINEPLPWGHLDMLVSNSYLKQEYEKAFQAALTKDCRSGCNNCFNVEHADYCTVS